METPKEYYYTYYSYEEWGRGYFGSRGCKCLPKEDVKYFGSFKDKTFRPTHKIILKDDYSTRKEAYADEIILQQYYKVVENPHFANRAYQTSTKFYCNLSKEQRIQNGKKGGKISGLKNKENKTGFCGMSQKKRSELGKRNSKKNKEDKKGIFNLTKKELSNYGAKGGKKTHELKKGLFSISPEKRYEICKKADRTKRHLKVGFYALTSEERSYNAKKNYQNGIGISSISPEKRSEIMKKVNSQKWKCLVTGYVSNPGGLSKYQKYRNIDTSQRVRVEKSEETKL